MMQFTNGLRLSVEESKGRYFLLAARYYGGPFRSCNTWRRVSKGMDEKRTEEILDKAASRLGSLHYKEALEDLRRLLKWECVEARSVRVVDERGKT